MVNILAFYSLENSYFTRA